MKSAKLIVGLVVVASAGALSLYIFGMGKVNSFPDINADGVSSSTTGNDNAAAIIKNYISEKVPEKIAEETLVENANITNTTSIVPDPNNLTDLFASELAKEVVMKNPEGPLMTDDGGQKINFPGTLDYESFLGQLKENGNKTDWQSAIVDTDITIKTTADNSKEAIIKYLTAIIDILSKKPPSELPVSSRVTDISSVTKTSQAILDKSQGILPALKAVIVPESLATFHKQLLQIIAGKLVAFTELANSKTDPLGALVAVGWLQDIGMVEVSWGEGLLGLVKKSFSK